MCYNAKDEANTKELGHKIRPTESRGNEQKENK